MNTAVDCLAQADLLLLLAEMLGAPASWTEDRRAIDRSDIEALAGQGVSTLEEAIAQWQDTDAEAASVEYYRLFDGSATCAPNETIYVRRDKGAVLADIAGFYRAFGFELADAFREKHDHVVAELQFAALLLVLVGRADDAGNAEQGDIAETALRSFLTDHLGVWIGSFAERLEVVSTLPCYVAAARLAADVWEMLKIQHDLANFKSETLSPEEQAGTPYECGMC